MNTHELTTYANRLRVLANEADRLAETIKATPNPVGYAIVDIAKTLARHGLCVVERNALMEVFEAAKFCPDDDYNKDLECMIAVEKALEVRSS